MLLELVDFFIAQVLENCHRIFDVRDVFRYVEVWRKEHAIAILNIISQCFGDVELVAELDLDFMEDVDIGPGLGRTQRQFITNGHGTKS